MSSAVKTVLETIQGGAKYLEKRGIEEGRLSMEHMVAHVLGCQRLQLYLDFDRPLAEEELGPLREMLKKRGEGVPLQHLLGTVEFLGRDFRSDERALVPRPETEELVEGILGRVGDSVDEGFSVVDVGTGSGVIGLSLALRWARASVWMVDRSGEALGLAEENRLRLDVDGERVVLVEGDLFSGLDEELCFDVVVANLPYVADGDWEGLAVEVKRDPKIALLGGERGTELMVRMIRELPGRMKAGGWWRWSMGWGRRWSWPRRWRKLGLRKFRLKMTVRASRDLCSLAGRMMVLV